jgi:5-methylcytosine-specific restriction endonuclease McrA
MAADHSTHACVICGTPFPAKPRQIYCSVRCCSRARDLRVRKRSREEVRAASPHWRYCAACFKHYYGRPSGTNAKSGYDRKFCSMACRIAMRERVRLEVALLRRMAARPVKAARLSERTARVEANRARRESDKAMMFASRGSKPCGTCGAPVGYGGTFPRRYCSRACRRRSDVGRAAKRVSKAVRRARKRGAVVYESVLPIKVFERSGWRCQICGVKTPAKHRGTHRHDAPELDHVVPLSKGGAHTYANAQCVCRACNGWKSDKVVVGQRLLFA